eukprot:GEMP01000137.1.p1 GENE.GEMP01000137.1~~GEMP01000137.1.p1  ORF type:complete len:2966 (+),score=813.16 GEMP01000137.1:107-8899(+)
MGNSSRLVITPLTERCYRTLVMALHLLYGGAPEGPTGTGKTETVKDLAKTLARMCIVFNCSDALDYVSMSKFFKGIAGTGAWCCFEEFNRINVEVLSVIAQEIFNIQHAISGQQREFDFEGTWLPLQWTCNVFITTTLNVPHLQGSELPDTLKMRLRTVAMMVPDMCLIAEITLYAAGFHSSRVLARKIACLYTLCSEQLSPQCHYDCGLRAVMAVLSCATSFKRQSSPEEDEDALTMRAIMEVNTAKLVLADVPLFKGICADLFPHITLPTHHDASNNERRLGDALHSASVDEYYKTHNLQKIPYLEDKTAQLYDSMHVRHGCMLLGQSYSGKTTSLMLLRHALSSSTTNATEVQLCTLNPKAIQLPQLFGFFDRLVTRDWVEGILPVLFRTLAKPATSEDATASGNNDSTAEKKKWLHFDGPVSADWIDNLNTVLDDNKKLCLETGEIITMDAKSMNVVFETDSLHMASPATVSRCGMVFYEVSSMGSCGHVHLLESFMAALSKLEHLEAIDLDEVTHMVEWIAIYALLPVMRSSLGGNDAHQVIPTSDPQLLATLLLTMEGFLSPWMQSPEVYAEPQKREVHIHAWVIMSAIWSIGAVCTAEARLIFDASLKKVLNNQLPNIKPYKKVIPSFPDRNTCFDYYWDAENMAWALWATLLNTLSAKRVPSSGDSAEVMVRTVDSIRYSFFAHLNLSRGVKTLLCGPTATGKTMYMNSTIATSLDKNIFTSMKLDFSAQTSCNSVQDAIDARVERRRKDLYGPAPGKRLIVFVDDMNLPCADKWGSVPPIELLRQFFDYSGWYERKDPAHPFRKVVDVIVVACMGVPGGARAFLSPRFLRHFHCIAFPRLEDAHITRIFQTILDTAFAQDKFPTAISALSGKLVKMTLGLYHATCSHLLPTPMKSHYTFSVRDVDKVICGMLLLKKEEASGDGAADKVMRLWVHEALRVFSDRLVDDHDRLWMLCTVRDYIRSANVSFDQILSHLDTNDDGKVDTLEEICGLIFGDMLHPTGHATRPYDEITDRSLLQSCVEGCLEQINMLSQVPMDLVIFDYALEHMARIARILKMPTSKSGGALLVGVCGSGRQSLAKLASYMADYQIFTLSNVSRSYGSGEEWNEDMKMLLAMCGGKGEHYSFLLRDAEIVTERIMEDIAILLKCADLGHSTLWSSADEKAEVLEEVRQAIAYEKPSSAGDTNDGEEDTGSTHFLYAKFVERCREKLHIVLCVSPIGRNNFFRRRMRAFPDLVNCVTIDWFAPWPAAGLQTVAGKYFDDVSLGAEVKQASIRLCHYMHTTVTDARCQQSTDEANRTLVYTTTVQFVELLKIITHLYEDKKKDSEERMARYSTALQKLSMTLSATVSMQKELNALKPQLIEQEKNVEDAMQNVAEETVNTDKVRAVVKREEMMVKEMQENVRAINEECEMEFVIAMPALQQSLQALDTLTSSEINDLKALRNPPSGVKKVLEAVCLLKGVKPVRVKDESGVGVVTDYWGPSQKLLAEGTAFMKQLAQFDKDDIPPDVMKKVAKFTVDDDFDPTKIARVNKAAYALCCWVRAMETYDKVAQLVSTKRTALREAESEYARAAAELDKKLLTLADLDERLEMLIQQCTMVSKDWQHLQRGVEERESKLQCAEKLTACLGSATEKEDWERHVARLSEDLGTMRGDVMLAAGALVYLGPFAPGVRHTMLQRWIQFCRTTTGEEEERGIAVNAEFQLTTFFGKEEKIRSSMPGGGLAKDPTWLDNALIVCKNTARAPLLIDPQLQGTKWIKKMESANKVQVLRGGASPVAAGENSAEAGRGSVGAGGAERRGEGVARVSRKGGGADNYLKKLEYAVQLGTSVILTDVIDEDGNADWDLDPALDHLLLKQIFKRGGGSCVQIGGALCEYESSFRLYLVTTTARGGDAAAMRLLCRPDIVMRVNVVNFTMTVEALVEHLLGICVANEEPEVENNKVRYILENGDRQAQMEQLEESIVRTLASSAANILDDENAITELGQAKALHTDLLQQQQRARDTEALVDAAREVYRPLAASGATLFGVCASLGSVNCMYYFSLQYVGSLLSQVIASSSSQMQVQQAQQAQQAHQPQAVLSTRVHALTEQFRHVAYRTICRSLFARHKLLFSITLALHINEGMEEACLVRFFLTGCRHARTTTTLQSAVAAAAAEDEMRDKPADWMSPAAWEELLRLRAVTDCLGAALRPEVIARDIHEWWLLYDAHDDKGAHAGHLPPHHKGDKKKALLLLPFPKSVEKSGCSELEKIAILIAVRPDQVVPALTEWIKHTLGAQFVHVPPFDLQAVYAESDETSPLIFVCSPGCDPLDTLEHFATAKRKKMVHVALGKGQGPRAEIVLKDGMTLGQWVLVQNCHLARNWMPRLAMLCESMTTEKVHSDFRLWLSSYPFEQFPISILSTGFTITNDPPQQLKSNLINLFHLDPICDPDFLGNMKPGRQNAEWKKLLFGLLMFHAVCEERKLYGAVGWNIPYDFTESDVRMSVKQLRRLIVEQEQNPFKAMQYIVSELHYGGRVQDDNDRRLIHTLFADYVCEQAMVQSKYKYVTATVSNGCDSYVCPEPLTSIEEYCMRIQNNFPDVAPSEVVGLHPNASITKNTLEAHRLFADLRALEHKNTRTTTQNHVRPTRGDMTKIHVEDDDSAEAHILDDGRALCGAIVEDLARKLPPEFDLSMIDKKYPITQEEAMHAALYQECLRYNVLLRVLHASLTTMQLALACEVVMTPECEDVCKAIYDSTVPHAWLKHSYLSLRPLQSYFGDLCDRCGFFTSWVVKGIPNVLWLPGFYFPKSVLTAVKQNFARKQTVAIDLVVFDHRIPTEEIRAKPEDGAYINGLFLEGAKWDEDGMSLAESDHHAITSQCPLLWLIPCKSENIAESRSYKCPVYLTSLRRDVLSSTGNSTNFVMWIQLPSSREESHWIKRGVALLTQLDT